MAMLGFSETRIYQRGRELVRISGEVVARLPAGHGYLADQLRRASSSVVLNFAEGYAKTSRAEQRRFFGIARASAQETLAIFDIALDLRLIDNDLHARGADA